MTFRAITMGGVKLDTLVIMSASAAKARPQRSACQSIPRSLTRTLLYILIDAVGKRHGDPRSRKDGVGLELQKFVSEMNVM